MLKFINKMIEKRATKLLDERLENERIEREKLKQAYAEVERMKRLLFEDALLIEALRGRG